MELTPTNLQHYLDERIAHWRQIDEAATKAGRSDEAWTATCMIDAYQAMRVTFIGESLPRPDGQPVVQVVTPPEG